MMQRSKVCSVVAIWLMAIVTALMGVSCGGGTNTNTPLANNGVTQTPTPDPCASITDTEIVNNIYSELAKVAELRTQLPTIDVTAKTRAVTLFGWVLTDAELKQVVEIAKNSKCVTSVNADSFYVAADVPSNSPLKPAPGGGCAVNYIRCGDICIPSGTGCGLEKAQSTSSSKISTNANMSTNSTSNSRSNSNTAANSNTNSKKY
ncbi:MAG: BON domain-containing protein [Pyrinomonadaceae bacterium]